MIHVDIWGPYSIPSIHGHKYFLIIVDDYSRYTWIFPLKQKFEVVKGYTQTKDIDYLDTFSPLAKMITIRLLLSLASIYNWELRQLDINNVFSHGDLKEDVYMVVPPGLTSIPPGKVCKLKKGFI